MELIKDLPEVFEEFAEQRQKSFLAVKELKEKGKPLLDFGRDDSGGRKGSSEESLSADQIKLWICKDRQMSILLFLRRSSWGNNL